MKITAYNVISQDGFVATKDRKEDFIPDELWDSFIEICNQNDVLIFGKHTYEAFLRYNQELIDQFSQLTIKKVILTRDAEFIPESPFIVMHSAEEVSMLGESILVSGSATLNNLFVQQNLLDFVVVNVVPVMLYDGIPQFQNQPELTLLSEEIHTNWITKVYASK